MKRNIKFGLLICTCLSLLVSPVSVKAEETVPTVTFDGKKLVYSGYDASAWGEAFHDMYPGQSKTQKMLLVNASDKTVDFYMDTAVIQAFEDMEGAEGAAYQVSLTMEKDGEEFYLYGADDSHVAGTDSEGMYEITDGSLGETMLVSTMIPKESVPLYFSLKLDGESVGNSYQADAGEFEFVFSVAYDNRSVTQEELSEVIVTEKETRNVVVKTVNTVETLSAPITADNTVIWPALVFIGGGILLIIAGGHKRKIREKEDL